jgi:hypothetical protein|nr:MAG TPA: hypothetical protein [Caudoviricetes sp.]
MKRIGIFTTGFILLFPFIICLTSDDVLAVAGGVIYLSLLIAFIPKKWKRRFFVACTRLSNIFGNPY